MKQIGPRITVILEWEPRDLWVGVYWTRDKEARDWWHVYVCVIPCLALHFWWHWPLNGTH